MDGSCFAGFARPMPHLLLSNRLATAQDLRSNGRLLSLAYLLFQALTNSAFLIRRAVMVTSYSARRGKQCGALPAIHSYLSLCSTPIEKRQP